MLSLGGLLGLLNSCVIVSIGADGWFSSRNRTECLPFVHFHVLELMTFKNGDEES